MNTALWILQGFLALLFFGTGLFKLTQSREELEAQMPWAEDFSARTVKLIGVAEILAAIGLILPPLLDILPWLTPIAATGLVADMAGAFMTHRRRGESQYMIVTAILLVLAVIVAIGRFGPESF
jgi:uncharacterized membrane protein YphA (DoxX/SURF4 family)